MVQRQKWSDNESQIYTTNRSKRLISRQREPLNRSCPISGNVVAFPIQVSTRDKT